MSAKPTYEELENRVRELERMLAERATTPERPPEDPRGEDGPSISAEQYRLMVENANEAILVAQGGVFVFSNQRGETLFGYSKRELAARPLAEFVHEADRKMVDGRHEGRLTGDTSIPDVYPFRIIHESGDIRWVNLKVALCSWEDRPAALCFMTDITEQKQAEETLRKYAAILRAVTDPVACVNRNYIVEIVNDARANRVGKSKEDFIGRHISEIHGREHFERSLRGYMDRCFAGETVLFREWFSLPDGSNVFLDVSYYPVYDENGMEIIGAAVYTRERTEQEKAEDALRRSEARYRAIFQNEHVVMLVIDPDTGAIRDANPAAAAFYGWSYEELTGMNIKGINILTPAEVENEMRAAHLKHRGYFHFRHQMKDGTIRDVEVSSGPVEYDEKVLLYSIVRDVTRRKQAEEALRESEARFRLIFEQATAGIAIVSADGRFIDANQAICDMLGYTREELLRMTVLDVTLSDDRDLSIQTDRPVLNGKQDAYRLEKRYRHKDGRSKWADLSSSVIRDENGSIRYAIGVVVDITQQKRVENTLKEREAFLDTLFNAIPIPVFYKNRAGRYLGFNDAYESFFGKSKERLTGKTVFDISPQDLALIYHAKDDELFESGGTQLYETQVKTAKGDLRDVIFNKSIYKDSKGDVAGLIGGILDVTETKKAEAALKNALAEKEVLLREIHHRVKNNMQVIISLFRMYCRKSHDARLKGIFDDCRGRIEAMSLIHEALYQSNDLARIDFQPYLKKLCRNLGHVHDDAIKGIAVMTDRRGVALDMDQGIAVGMVIAELISNAYKHAFPPGRTGNVSVKMTAPDPETVELTVADDGKGLPEDFDIQNPSSLGMRLVAGAVQRELGGSIEATNDGGAKFVIRFKCEK